MPKPKADLDALTIAKDAVPPPTSSRAVAEPRAYAHTLSFRMTNEGYRRLRRYVADQEAETGRRTTQQAIFEEALEEYFAKRGR
jgi:hypothetical protein